jgi:hypothetical protein
MDKLNKFVTIKNIFVVALIAIIVILMIKPNKVEVKTNTITIPEYSTIVDTVFVERIEYKTIVVKDGTAVVNKNKYEEYVKEIDTIKKKEQFVKAITVRDYKITLVDDARIKIDVNSKVEGNLLSSNASYTIKEQLVEPKTIYRNPRVSLILGAEVGYKNMEFNPRIMGGVQTSNGNIFSIGFDIDANISVGFSKRFTIIK